MTNAFARKGLQIKLEQTIEQDYSYEGSLVVLIRFHLGYQKRARFCRRSSLPRFGDMSRDLTRQNIPSTDKKTRKEIDRQHTLLAAELDKRALKGNAKVEDWRHYKEFTGLTKKEKRERFEITQQRNEILDELKKVRRGYTGHYDETKSPIENIQSALRHQSQTPLRSSRLDVPNVYPMRKTKSMESMPLRTRPTSLPRLNVKPSDPKLCIQWRKLHQKLRSQQNCRCELGSLIKLQWLISPRICVTPAVAEICSCISLSKDIACFRNEIKSLCL